MRNHRDIFFTLALNHHNLVIMGYLIQKGGKFSTRLGISCVNGHISLYIVQNYCTTNWLICQLTSDLFTPHSKGCPN